MRIAFLIDEFPSLSETFILNQIVGLLDRGQEVDIYADSPGDMSKVHPEVESYQLLSRTYYTQMPPGRSRRIPKGIRLFLANFHKAPRMLLRALNLFEYKYSDYGDQAALLRLLYSAIPFLGKQPYDIIHCHYGRNGTRGAILRDIGVLQGKLIAAFHGFDISTYIDRYGESIYEKLFARGDLFQPIGENWKRRLIELGCEEKKIMVHRMGIDCTKFSFTPRQPDPNGSIRLVSIARLVEKKGLEYGIRAVAKLARDNPNIEYKIAGDGFLREDLQQLIRELNLSKQVKLLGWQQQQEILALLKWADILLAPSVTSSAGDREGIPVTLMEAMAMGLPVVSTQHSGIPELVQDGVSGFLVPERDVDALADKLEYLIGHSERWPEMGRAGRAYIEECYDINKLNDRLVEIYQQLISP
ncbi:MAG: colanic acid biosynthesis glycosyltransferase WcaL [Oscillatoria sp. SIO1A7]|nr:colanic acid biosynthesis glycosyltransferase WcaL [Oscillatoria sp. SIO1A7]